MEKNTTMKLQNRLLNTEISTRHQGPEKAGLTADAYEQLYKFNITQREAYKTKSGRSLILK
jgi:hypothetical protein